jgi:hypothetical protein
MKFLAPRLGLLFAFPLLAGCATKTGHVTGKVTYKGNPVPAGWVYFRPADPALNMVSASLNEDGAFEVDLPAGEVTVTIDNRDWEPPPAAGAVPSVPPNIPLSAEARAKLGPAAAPKKHSEPRPAGKSGQYMRIPDKYYDGATSGLTFTVTGAAQTQNIELVD